jgi:hypothetical protein
MRRPSILRAAAAVAGALAVAAITPGWATSSAAKAVTFNAPVQVTPANGGGYEPGIYVDRYGNLFMTAHKENFELGLSPDGRSQTGTRSMSWAWWSSDRGKTWKNLPLGPADLRNHEFGDEGDMATDDAQNLYFVDTTVADVTITSWHVGQNGPEFTFNTPLAGTAQALDDRPWIAAHGDGHVFYFGNQGDKDTYPAGDQSAGPGAGPGRYTVYRSTDGAQSFDRIGVTLNDSGWCRPAAAPHSQYVYAICTNDGGADDEVHNAGEPGYDHGILYAYVSPDDGKTWYRYPISTYNSHDSWTSYPTVQVMQDGSIWASYVDGLGTTNGETCTSSQCTPGHARVLVMHSTDHGKHWKVYDATPAGAAKNWQYRYGWLAVANDGKTLGLSIYGRPLDTKKSGSEQAAWRVYGSVFRAGQHPVLVDLDPKHPATAPGFSSPPGDFLMSVFDKQNKLHAAWTRVVTTADTPAASAYVYRDIYTVSQR